MGVNVTGDADQAYWTSSQVISALVITAGGVSYNVALDFPETVGSVSPHNYSVFGGASMDALAFCTGEATQPDTTTRGPSITLSKTAECATLGSDGMATVTGTITAESDSRSLSARVTTAMDTILGPDDAVLERNSVGALVGQVLTPGNGPTTVDYEITFDPGDVGSFDNFIEVTIEDADTGEDRQKIYNARAAFELCDEGEEPGEREVEVMVMKHLCPDVSDLDEFVAIEEAAAAATDNPFAPLAATVIACPTVVEDAGDQQTTPADVGGRPVIAGGQADFDFSVADGGTQTLSTMGAFETQALCASDVGLADPFSAEDACLDTSHYGFTVDDGVVVVTETEAPDDASFGTLRFTPLSGDNSALVTLDESTGVITLDTTLASDDVVADGIMLHVYNFSEESGGQVLPGNPTPKPREGTKGGNLPDTAVLPEMTGSAPAALLALLMLFGLSAGGWAVAAEARRRR
jgi:hypothetical protein